MAIADWFRRKARYEVAESVWLKKTGKLDGIHHQILMRSVTDAAVVVLAHFPDTLLMIEAMLQDRKIAFESRERIEGSALAALARQTGDTKVFTGLATALSFDPVPEGSDPQRSVSIILAERHPLRDKDDVVQDFAGGVPCRLMVHVSLEDGLMKAFAGDTTMAVLGKLGMSDGDKIEHPMISAAILRAQKKIRAKATGDQPAASAGEWLIRNCPSLP